jgi:GMP synthase (glutamine-hydrolysing)
MCYHHKDKCCGLGKSAVIKSHHNVGGLPDYVDLKK